jgi:hypothetical protein
MDTFHVVFQTVTNTVLLVGIVYVIAFIRRVERDRLHHVRTPVAAIKGLAEAAQATPGDSAKHLRAISSLADDALSATDGADRRAAQT